MANGRSSVRKNRFDRGYLKGFRFKNRVQKNELRQAINNGRRIINSDGIFLLDISAEDITLVRSKLTKMNFSDIQVVYPHWIIEMIQPAVGQ